MAAGVPLRASRCRVLSTDGPGLAARLCAAVVVLPVPFLAVVAVAPFRLLWGFVGVCPRWAATVGCLSLRFCLSASWVVGTSRDGVVLTTPCYQAGVVLLRFRCRSLSFGLLVLAYTFFNCYLKLYTLFNSLKRCDFVDSCFGAVLAVFR